MAGGDYIFGTREASPPVWPRPARWRPRIVGRFLYQWAHSEHARLGVGCFECHRANDTDADGYLHESQRIATIVTPADCASCHATEPTRRSCS